MSTGVKAASVGRSDIFRVPFDYIKIKPGLNARDLTTPEAIAKLNELAWSIANEGVRDPFTGYMEGDVCYLTDGHRRHAATIIAMDKYEAKIESVPIKMEPRGTSEAERIARQLNTGEPLTALEEAHNFSRLLALGWTEDKICQSSGRTLAHIRARLDLRAAPAAVTEMVRTGEVSPSLALKTVKAKGGEKATKELTLAVEKAHGEGKVRATEKHMPEPKKEPVVVLDLRAKLEAALTRCAVAERLLAACDVYWDASNRECSHDSPADILRDHDINVVVAIERGGVVETRYHVLLGLARLATDYSTEAEARAAIDAYSALPPDQDMAA